MQLAFRALHGGQAVQGLAQLRTQLVDVDTGLGQQVTGAATLLVQQGHHQVHRLDELVVASHGQALGVHERHLELAGQFVHSHCLFSPLVKNLLWS